MRNEYTKSNFPIDAVILWVDGNDKVHRDKMLPFIKDKSKINSKKFRTRFDQVNEIKFTVDSILKFAPYIKKIHIVTDNQTPRFLANSKIYKDKVSIIDHKIIFKGFEQYLPTFNCRSIETCIYRIPNLSEHFIYFNDDFFLINPTCPEDFYSDGNPILRGKWKKFDENIFYKRLKKIKKGHKTAQQNAAKIIGFRKYYNFKHTPHPMRKSTFKNFFDRNPAIFEENIKYRFRNASQFTPQGLANHIEIKNKTFVFNKELRLMYFRSYKKPLLWYKFKLNYKTSNHLFLGLQSLDRCNQKILTFLLSWVTTRTSN